MKHGLFFVVCALLLPASSHARVIINEIAWMGTAVSANDEWIELYNDGSDPISLDGWRLSGEDGVPNITLSGTIGPLEFFLLERTDDDTVVGVAADLIYTGALGNDTEHLILANGEGASQDSVKSGDAWSLGGNNTTKHTAQRQQNDVWITGIPTPRAANSTEDTGRDDGEVKGESTSGGSKSTRTTTNGYKQKVYAYAGQDIAAVAGAYAFLESYGVNEKNERLGIARYLWTFGDGDDAQGQEVRHVYRFPGTYTAVLTISADDQKSRDKILVHVTLPEVSIRTVAYGDGGFVEVHNESARELDVSGWRIRGEYADGKHRTKTFAFPSATFIAPYTAIPFPAAVTGVSLRETDRVVVLLPSGTTAAWHDGPSYQASERDSDE